MSGTLSNDNPMSTAPHVKLPANDLCVCVWMYACQTGLSAKECARARKHTLGPPLTVLIIRRDSREGDYSI